jgi:hypothetical protein
MFTSNLIKTSNMKALSAFITLMLIWNLSFSQVNYPIPQDSTSTWRINFVEWFPLTTYINTTESKVFVNGDTVINDHLYSIFFSSGLIISEYFGIQTFFPFENKFYALIRTDSARTYEYIDGQDELLYDFSLQAGDTLPETIINENTVVISSIDSVLVAGKYLKKFNIYDSVSLLLSHWYIEGIGHELGLIEPMYQAFAKSYSFDCYAENGIPIFPEGSDCDMAVYIDEEAVYKQTFSVYPNPSNGIINLGYKSSLDKDVHLEVVDVLGNVIINNTWQLKNGLNYKSIDLFKSGEGLYFVIIQDGNSTVRKKVIIAD